MTATRTPSERGRSNRRKGLTCERYLCRWLRTAGFPGAERAVRAGFRTADRISADPGDITGTPGIVWSVKDCAAEQVRAWQAELLIMQTLARADFGLLVLKRRGHADPAHWWCWLTLRDLLMMTTEVRPAPAPEDFLLPVRMELRHVTPLLRAAGYGTPPEDT